MCSSTCYILIWRSFIVKRFFSVFTFLSARGASLPSASIPPPEKPPASGNTHQRARISQEHDKLKLFPIANKNFAIYPVRILPSAGETLAIGKLKICNRQVRHLPSASETKAVGKFHTLINGKFEICQWQTCKVTVYASFRAQCALKLGSLPRAASISAGEEGVRLLLGLSPRSKLAVFEAVPQNCD